MGRLARAGLALLLAALLLGLPAARSAAAAEWTWVASPSSSGLGAPTLLDDGTVLVSGGEVAERYDPAADRWRPAGRLATYHSGHTATRLPDGRVLIVGGFALPFTGNAAAEIFDPAAEGWTAAASLSTPRVGHTATLLPDGTVLVVGGSPDAQNTGLATAERYDPATDTWRPAGAMATTRFLHTATLLASGLVLVAGGMTTAGGVGGGLATAELYDPATDTWRLTGALAVARAGQFAVTLPDEHVLLIGGAVGTTQQRISDETEIYDPGSGRWRAGARVPLGRVATATPLPGGQVLATGGDFAGNDLLTARYDPATDTWAASALRNGVGRGAATLLADGRVLIVGDLAAEIYRGDAPEPAARCFAETGFCVRGRFLAHWEAHGGLAINGYPISEEMGQDLPGGGPHRVQYFERARLEYHPRNAAPYDVLLGQFGRQIVAGVPGAPVGPVGPVARATHFPETGHNVGARFGAYWRANGGLAQFGYPLTEEFAQQLEDGQTYTVQYFERARFEHHPEHAGTPDEVQLGQFGRQILAGVGR